MGASKRIFNTLLHSSVLGAYPMFSGHVVPRIKPVCIQVMQLHPCTLRLYFLSTSWNPKRLSCKKILLTFSLVFLLVNVNKIKDFGEAAKREILSDRHAFETARRLSHDNMEEKVPWVCPRPLVLPSPLVTPGSNSQERYIQAEREKGILQELFLNKER